MWKVNEKGQCEFFGGKNSYEDAAEAASNCDYFKEDDEDEFVSDERLSCYNCRYRRWSEEGFVCLKRKTIK